MKVNTLHIYVIRNHVIKLSNSSSEHRTNEAHSTKMSLLSRSIRDVASFELRREFAGTAKLIIRNSRTRSISSSFQSATSPFRPGRWALSRGFPGSSSSLPHCRARHPAGGASSQSPGSESKSKCIDSFPWDRTTTRRKSKCGAVRACWRKFRTCTSFNKRK